MWTSCNNEATTFFVFFYWEEDIRLKKKYWWGLHYCSEYCILYVYLYLNIIKIDSCEGDGLRQEFQMTRQVVQIFCGIRLLKELGGVTYNIDVVEIKILNSWIYKSVKM